MEVSEIFPPKVNAMDSEKRKKVDSQRMRLLLLPALTQGRSATTYIPNI